MLFVKSRHPYKQDPWINVTKLLNVSTEQAKRSTQDQSGFVGGPCSHQCNSMVTGLPSEGF